MKIYKKTAFIIILFIFLRISTTVKSEEKFYMQNIQGFNTANAAVGPLIIIRMESEVPVCRRRKLHINKNFLISATTNAGSFSPYMRCKQNFVYICNPVHSNKKHKLYDRINNLWLLPLCQKRANIEWKKLYVKENLPNDFQKTIEQKDDKAKSNDRLLSTHGDNEGPQQKMESENSSGDNPEQILPGSKQFKTLMHAAKQHAKLLTSQGNGGTIKTH